MQAPLHHPLRHVAFEGTPNFRDYGGYRTDDGRQVKWGALYRSGQLAALTQDDVQRLATLDIRLVFDFRRREEQSRDPSRFPEAVAPTVIGLPIDPGSTLNFLDAQADARDFTEFMCRINREFVESHSMHYRRMFEYLLDHDRGASLIHCSAGKDRTGFAAAMILSALGVPRDVVLQDYMLTAHFFDIDREIDRLRRKYQWQGEPEAIRPVLDVREQYLNTAFDAIAERFSDLNEYLREELGVDEAARAVLRRRYLE